MVRCKKIVESAQDVGYRELKRRGDGAEYSDIYVPHAGTSSNHFVDRRNSTQLS